MYHRYHRYHRYHGYPRYLMDEVSNGSLIDSVTDPLWKYLYNTFTSKPEELRSWTFEKRFTYPYLSCVICHVSCVTCHMSHVIYLYICCYFFDKLRKLVGGGSVFNRATLSIFFGIYTGFSSDIPKYQLMKMKKLDRVGPVDNRPSIEKHHHFVKK